MGLNHINTKETIGLIKKGSHEARTQIRTEFVKNPAYRIYVSHEDNKVLTNLLKTLWLTRRLHFVTGP